MVVEADGWYTPPQEQHQRLVALRQLASRDIPCILWGEDALCYAHLFATLLFSQRILVPDELLDTAAAVLQEGPYVPTQWCRDYGEISGPNKGASPFPKSIRLRHVEIPEDQQFKLEPLPGRILLLPQSYYGLDVRDKHRFQSLVPPLPPSNADILVPKFNTFLEGLVHFIMNPPQGTDVPERHFNSRFKHDIFIGYLCEWRVKYDMDVDPPIHELYPEEERILSELQTHEARWYIHRVFWTRKPVRYVDMVAFKQGATSTASVSS